MLIYALSHVQYTKPSTGDWESTLRSRGPKRSITSQFLAIYGRLPTSRRLLSAIACSERGSSLPLKASLWDELAPNWAVLSLAGLAQDLCRAGRVGLSFELLSLASLLPFFSAVSAWARQLPDSSEHGAGRHVGGYRTYAPHIQGQDMSGNKGDKMSIYQCERKRSEVESDN